MNFKALDALDWNSITAQIIAAFIAVLAGFVSQWYFEYTKSKKKFKADLALEISQLNILSVKVVAYLEHFSTLAENYIKSFEDAAAAELEIKSESDTVFFDASKYCGLMLIHPQIENFDYERDFEKFTIIKFDLNLLKASMWIKSYVNQLKTLSDERYAVSREVPSNKVIEISGEELNSIIERIHQINLNILVTADCTLDALIKINSGLNEIAKKYKNGAKKITLPEHYNRLQHKMHDYVDCLEDRYSKRFLWSEFDNPESNVSGTSPPIPTT